MIDRRKRAQNPSGPIGRPVPARRSRTRRSTLYASIGLASISLLALALPAAAAERELDQASPPSSVEEIKAPTQRVFPEDDKRSPLFERIAGQLQDLPPFLADTRLEARFRTYYLRNDKTTGSLSEALTSGGSLYYRSGWLADLLAIEVEGFTSQPLYAPQDRDGTDLLRPVQDGYSVLGIANARIRYKGVELVGFRQYLDLPYLNRSDSRMTPNTFEAVTLAKPEGSFRFSTGYTWKIKRRSSTDFESLTEAVGLEQDRGLAHAGAIWDPTKGLHVGAVVGVIPDLTAGVYSELGFARPIADDLEARIDTQFTYREAIGDDLLGPDLGAAWNLGVRGSSSWKGAVLRLGLSVTGSKNALVSFYGSNPSYADLMQRTFTRADEKVFLASFSYDFAGLGADGLSMITNFAAAFDGKLDGARGDAQELDVTIDYHLTEGLLRGFWFRLRGSWLRDERVDREATEVRVILRYDVPLL